MIARTLDIIHLTTVSRLGSQAVRTAGFPTKKRNPNAVSGDPGQHKFHGSTILTYKEHNG